MNKDEFKIVAVKIFIDGVGWTELQQVDNRPIAEDGAQTEPDDYQVTIRKVNIENY